VPIPYTDPFTGATQDIDVYNTDYEIIHFTANVARVSGGQFINNAGQNDCRVVYGPPVAVTPDHYVKATLRVTNAYATLFLRGIGTSGGGNCQGYWWQQGNFGYVLVNGGLSSLGSTTAPAADDVCEFWVTGSATPTLHFKINGGAEDTFTDTTPVGPLLNGSFGQGTDANNGAAWDDATFDNYPLTGAAVGYLLVAN
jgi:hypothetical protein